jgi:hypothetical protein
LEEFGSFDDSEIFFIFLFFLTNLKIRKKSKFLTILKFFINNLKFFFTNFELLEHFELCGDFELFELLTMLILRLKISM